MKITYELLQEKGACSDGLSWFKDNLSAANYINQARICLFTMKTYIFHEIIIFA